MKEKRGAKAIEGIVERWISREVQWAEVKPIAILGLDEIALKKGHRDFVVIVTGKAASDEVTQSRVARSEETDGEAV